MNKVEKYFIKVREGLGHSDNITFTKLYLLKFAEGYHQSRVKAISDDMQSEFDKVNGQNNWSDQFKKGYENCHLDYGITFRNKTK